MNSREERKAIVVWQTLFAVVLAGCASLPVETPGKAGALESARRFESALAAKATGHTLPSAPRLADYLAVAALNNPGLEAAFLDWKAALARIPQAKALPNPKFTYGYFIEQIETRTGAQKQKAGLVQTFPWFGKLRLSGEQAAAQAAAARQRYEAAKRQLFFEVKDAYYELFYLRQATSITRENIAHMQDLERVAQAKFRAGRDMADIVAMQMELGKLEAEAARLNDLEDAVAAKLNAVLNRPVEARMPRPQTFDLSDGVVSDAEAMMSLAGKNPTLDEWTARLEAADKAAALARKAFWPDVSLGVDYIDTGRARFPGIAGTGRDPVTVAGTVHLPLWQGKYRAGVREAEARRESARLNREAAANRLQADFAWVLHKLRDAERQMDLFGRALLPLAKSALEVAERAYQAGRSDFLQLIDAQRLLLDVRLSYQRAVADREQRLAEMEVLAGSLAPAASESKPSQSIDE